MVVKFSISKGVYGCDVIAYVVTFQACQGYESFLVSKILKLTVHDDNLGVPPVCWPLILNKYVSMLLCSVVEHRRLFFKCQDFLLLVDYHTMAKVGVLHRGVCNVETTASVFAKHAQVVIILIQICDGSLIDGMCISAQIIWKVRKLHAQLNEVVGLNFDQRWLVEEEFKVAVHQIQGRRLHIVTEYGVKAVEVE